MTTQPPPRPGDTYEKHGLQFMVHEVKDGEVYGRIHVVGRDDVNWMRFDQLRRVPLADYFLGIRGATKVV